MQNKGAIRLFAIALALVSLYQISFTLKSAQVKKDAKEFAQGELKKPILIQWPVKLFIISLDLENSHLRNAGKEK